VFIAYLIAVVTIVLASLAALGTLRAANPDVPDLELLSGVTGLVVGALASSTALILTVALVSQPFDAVTLRLVPGRERGLDLATAVVGMLALGQVLDSLAMLAGFGGTGSMPMIRRALTGAQGPDLLAAVLVLGLMAGAAEELFFRGYMQTRLRAAWPPAAAVIVASLAFGLLHMEWVHATMAFVLGLYLGVLTERTGSVLPAIVCHVVNNSLFTVLTALAGTVESRQTNAMLLALSAGVFVVCLIILRRRLPLGPA
jgi:hypothetical protein